VLEKLEQDLSYEDIRFFRSVAKAQAKKDADLKKRLQHEKEKSQGQQKSSGWLGWVWGGSSTAGNDTAGDDDMTISEADKAQLNEIIDYDPSAASTSGSLALRTDPHGAKRDLISLVFDSFAADVTQMPQSLDARISLGDFSVFDGTTLNTLHHKIVRVKEGAAIGNASVPGEEVEVDPFFTLRFERNPLDRRADTGVAIRMRDMLRLS
jgi:vacuolar protein sorting-associated protein 13A/C